MQQNSTLTLVDTIFKQSTSGNDGGCIYASQSTVTLAVGGELDRCTATGNGGGVFLDIQSTLYVFDGASIHDSDALNGNGGGAYVGGSTAYVWGDIADNDGTLGGGLYITPKNGIGSEAFVQGSSTVSGNTADAGGGIYTQLSPLTILDDARITGNHANIDGGGLNADGATVELAGSSLGSIAVSSNTADQRGAGAFIGVSSLTASFVTFEDNAASGNGGGLYVANTDASFTNVRVLDNSGTFGGGVLLDNSSLTMSSDFETCDPSTLAKERFCSEFRGNEAVNAQGQGGALRVVGGSFADIDTTSFVRNEAGLQGGAVSAKDVGTEVDLRNTLVIANQVASGPAVAMRDGILNVWSSTFSGNHDPVTYLAGSTGVFHRNLVWGNTTDAVTTGITGNCNTTQTMAGAPIGSNNDQLDPKFATNNARSAYKLKNTSPAIDACKTGPSVDLDGVGRLQRLAFDKGAFEMP